MFLSLNKYYNKLDVLVIIIIVFLGILNLYKPIMGDQALSIMMASTIDQGGTIYQDLWDLKWPGIFFFYYFAGKLFGFTEQGIHLFELLYMCLFSIVLIGTLKSKFRNQTMVSFIPLFTIGIYYSVSGILHQTQTEALVGFPIYLSLWFALMALNETKMCKFYLFLSGFFASIVLVFKIMFLPILVVFWLSAFLYRMRNTDEKTLWLMSKFVIPIILGIIPLFIILIIYFIKLNLLDLISWTFFKYPFLVMQNIPFRHWELLEGLNWFIDKFALLMALALIGSLIFFKKQRDLITTNLILWVLVGLAVILFQRLSWWSYHYLLVSVPLGILAAQGLDVILNKLKNLEGFFSKWNIKLILLFFIVLLFLPYIFSIAQKGLYFVYFRPFTSEQHKMNYQTYISEQYTAILSEISFLGDRESIPGKIYVFDTPLYYYLSKREPAIPIQARWFTPLPEQWDQLLEQLMKERPPYIFIEGGLISRLRNLLPMLAPNLDKTIPTIEEKYQLLRRTDEGVWYVLKSDLITEPSSIHITR